MNDLTTSQLQTLIRTLTTLQTFLHELEGQMHLEIIDGTGKLARRSYTSLHKTVATILDDDYVTLLTIDDGDLTEQQIVSQVLLAGKQLVAHLQSVTGLVNMQSHNTHIQTAPHIVINSQNSSEETKQDLFDMVRQAAKDAGKDVDSDIEMDDDGNVEIEI
ncbi:MAG: hypothetical protein AAFR81_20345 [Chloroflexota bacterium]